MSALNLLSPTTANVQNVQAEVPPATGGHGTSLLSFAASTAAKIEKATLVNNDSASHAVSIGICPTSSVASIANGAWLLKAFTLGPGESLPLGDYLEGAWLGDGDCVFGFVDSGALVTINASVTVFS